MTLDQAKEHLQGIIHSDLAEPDDSEALRIAVWAMDKIRYLEAAAQDVQGYPQSLTELYSWEQGNPFPGDS